MLADARPLADLLWMRETSGGVFDTPERKAELEKTLRDLTGRIKDENVRFHYAQEMRERVQTFFGRATQKPQAGDWDKRDRGKRRARGAGRPVREARRSGKPLRRVGKPGAVGDGQARRRRDAAARGGDRRGARQPSRR